ncbi:MAG: ParB N-terminal domain-containing protein [Patescibacteria group bacterium]
MTNQTKEIPNIKIVSIKSLLVHEESDPKRVRRLTRKISHNNVFTNPLIVGQTSQLNNLVIVDGVNRYQAMIKLGFKYVPAQIINYFDKSVNLMTWNHLIAGITKKNFLKKIILSGIKPRTTNLKTAKKLLKKNKISSYFDFGGCIYKIDKDLDYKDYITDIGKLVKTYAGKARIYRVREGELKDAKNIIHQGATLLVFLPFSKKEVVKLVKNNLVLPSGLTRHLIPERVLKLNVPLSILKSNRTLSKKNHWLVKFIENKVNNNQVRLYPESTYIFDE